VLSLVVFSLWLRCCLFLHTCPLGVDTTHDLGVLPLETTVSGIYQFLPTLTNYQVKCQLFSHNVDDHSSVSVLVRLLKIW